MGYELDPELVPVLAALAQRAAAAGGAGAAPAPPRGDWKALREAGEPGQTYLATLVPPSSGVRTSTHFATAPDGAAIELRRLAPYLTWTWDDNFTAWSAVLGEDLGTPAVSPIAAPARLADYRGLAPAYIDVGDLDIFRNEDLSYGRSLAQAGVPVELHLHPGAPHGWERFAPYSGSARRALADRGRVIAAL